MLHEYARKIIPPLTIEGRINASNGPFLTAQLPLICLGATVEISLNGQRSIEGIVTSIRGDTATIAPLANISGIMSGSIVRSRGLAAAVKIPEGSGGRVIDALGIDLLSERSLRQNSKTISLPLYATPPPALLRRPITQILETGISAIDGFAPIGYGQRLSLIAPAGTGKSTLLGMISRNAAVDYTVIGLIGERGREVSEFIEAVQHKNLNRTTIVVSTSDEPPIKKLLAAETTLAIAERYRCQGKRVLLILDSLTRLARAMRDIGLSNGELPVRQGYPASVLVELPKLLERAGNSHLGSITALFSVLQEDGLGNDFMTHEITSLLDGHIVLDSLLAQRGHYPAIDITRSLSRLLPKLLSEQCQQSRGKIVRMAQRLARDRDLLLFGGTPDAELSSALALEEDLNQLLKQPGDVFYSVEETFQRIKRLAVDLV